MDNKNVARIYYIRAFLVFKKQSANKNESYKRNKKMRNARANANNLFKKRRVR